MICQTNPARDFHLAHKLEFIFIIFNSSHSFFDLVLLKFIYLFIIIYFDFSEGPRCRAGGKCRKSVAMLSLEHEVGAWDSVLLEPLSEDSFISNLQQRFKRDHIYTYIGNVLISINPYKKLALYSTDLAEVYCKKGLFQLPPHM